MARRELFHGVYVSNQPSEAELQGLVDQGFRSVVNLRTGDEAVGPAPEEEERIVHGMGLEYVRVPIAVKHVRIEDLDRLRENLAHLPRPVLVHCRNGRRSMALTIAATSPDVGWDGMQAVKEARSRGAELKASGLEKIVREYADSRRGTTADGRVVKSEEGAETEGGEKARTQSN